MAKQRLGELLLQLGIIGEEQLKTALGHQKKWGGRIGEIFVELGYATESSLCEGLSKALRLPMINLTKIDASSITREILVSVPLTMAREHSVVPLAIREIRGRKRLIVCTSDPTNYKVFDDLQFKSGLPLLVMIAPRSDIQWFIRYYYLGENNSLSTHYVSAVTQKNPEAYSEENMPIDSLAAIFDDSEFSKVTQIYRDKPHKDSKS